jgi:hypothetical protein
LLGLAGYGQEQLEFGGQLVLCVEAIGEVDSSDPAVRVNLHSISIISSRFNLYERETQVNTPKKLNRSNQLGRPESSASGGGREVGNCFTYLRVSM